MPTQVLFNNIEGISAENPADLQTCQSIMATNTGNLNKRFCRIREKEGIYSGVLRKVQVSISMFTGGRGLNFDYYLVLAATYIQVTSNICTILSIYIYKYYFHGEMPWNSL